MESTFEHRVVQSTAFAVELLWQSAKEHTSLTEKGMWFPAIFLILPLCLHKRTAASLAAKNRPGALYKALSEDREIVVGLQSRLEGHADKTIAALNLGVASGLLLLDTDDMRVFSGRATQIVGHGTEDARTMLSAATRVGQSVAELSFEHLCSMLGVTF